MVKAAGFIEGIAEVMGLPLETVRLACRMLREQGLLTTGARGVNAPDMTALDAARVLIWGLVSDRPIDAVSVVLDFGSLPFVGTFERTDLYPQYHKDHFQSAITFEQAVAQLFADILDVDDLIDGFRFAELEIQSSDLVASIVLDGTGYKFMHSFDMSGMKEEKLDKFRQDNAWFFDLLLRYERKIKQIRNIRGDELQDIADMIAER